MLVGVFADRVGVGAQVVLEAVFVPLHAAHDRIATPDVPDARKVLGGLRIAHGVLQFLAGQLVQDVVLDTRVVGGPGGLGLLGQLEGVLLELGEEGHPAQPHRLEDGVGGVKLGPLVLPDGVVLRELTVVAVLAGIDVVPQRRLLQARGGLPVLGESDGSPGVHRCQLLLADVVIQATTLLADAA